jgi:dihydrofolate reductase
MTISAIVALSQNDVIGKAGGLPWRLPAEMARFKQITMGHSIIMGRKTHESIGRALPGRQNIVISRNPDYKASGCLVVGSIDAALEAADDSAEVFIVGGSTIYEQAMPMLEKLYLTRVKAVVKGDKYFKFDEAGWKMIHTEAHVPDEKNKFGFELQEWVRR